MDNLKSLITNMDKRLDWNQYFMSIAYLTSNRSQRLQVGCVLVKDKRILVGIQWISRTSSYLS